MDKKDYELAKLLSKEELLDAFEEKSIGAELEYTLMLIRCATSLRTTIKCYLTSLNIL